RIFCNWLMFGLVRRSRLHRNWACIRRWRGYRVIFGMNGDGFGGIFMLLIGILLRSEANDRVLASECYGEMVIHDADTSVPFPFGDKRIELIKQGYKSGTMAKDLWTTTLFSWLRDVAKITRGLRELPYLETHDIERMVARTQTQW